MPRRLLVALLAFIERQPRPKLSEDPRGWWEHHELKEALLDEILRAEKRERALRRLEALARAGERLTRG